jgi:hypothetical protein
MEKHKRNCHRNEMLDNYTPVSGESLSTPKHSGMWPSYGAMGGSHGVHGHNLAASFTDFGQQTTSYSMRRTASMSHQSNPGVAPNPNAMPPHYQTATYPPYSAFGQYQQPQETSQPVNSPHQHQEQWYNVPYQPPAEVATGYSSVVYEPWGPKTEFSRVYSVGQFYSNDLHSIPLNSGAVIII